MWYCSLGKLSDCVSALESICYALIFLSKDMMFVFVMRGETRKRLVCMCFLICMYVCMKLNLLLK